MTAFAAAVFLPCTLKPPIAAEDCGVRPTWPKTTMPAFEIASILSATATPPSSLMASTPPSLMKRTALFTASSQLAWYAPKGMSPMR